MKNNYPRFYQSWLYKSVGLSMEQEVIPDEYIEPLFLLNRQWLKEEFDQEQTQWNTRHVMRSYTLYYMTMNMPKLWQVLDQSPGLVDAFFCDREEVHVTEFGCGPGTFIWAFLFYLFINKPEYLKKITGVRACDTSQEALDMAETLWKNLKSRPGFGHIKMEFVTKDWQSVAESKTDWAIFGNALVEDQKVDLAQLEAIPCEILCLIEPGTSNHFKELRRVRDHLVEEQWQIHFPCAKSTGACPMKKDDWCHFHINRFQLPFIQHISSKAGRLNPRHHFSAFLLSRSKILEDKENAWRILSQTRKAGRSHIRFTCNGESIQETVLNRKDKNDQNSDFGRWRRGTLYQWDAEKTVNPKRIAAEDKLKKLCSD